MPTDQRTVGRYPWFDLATQAFHAAVRQDYTEAEQVLIQLGSRFPDDMPQILLAWIDTALHASGADKIGEAVQVIGLDVKNGRLFNGDEPDSVTWAQAVIAARINDDPEAFEHLISSVPDNRTWTDYVWTVLTSSAMTMTTGRAALRRVGPGGQLEPAETESTPE